MAAFTPLDQLPPYQLFDTQPIKEEEEADAPPPYSLQVL